MSRQRWALTQTEKGEFRKRIERLRAAGADLDVSSFESASRDWIQVMHDQVSSVHALPTSSFLIIPARIVALAPRIIIQGFEVSSPAMDLDAWFFPSENKCYHFRDGTNFDRSEVLNHRVEAAGTLRHGEMMDGVLLGESLDAIPTGFANNSLIPICLSIVNQFGDVHKSTTEARLKRIAGRIQPRSTRRSSLFEMQDGSSGGSQRAVDLGDALPGHVSPPQSTDDCDGDQADHTADANHQETGIPSDNDGAD